MGADLRDKEEKEREERVPVRRKCIIAYQYTAEGVAIRMQLPWRESLQVAAETGHDPLSMMRSRSHRLCIYRARSPPIPIRISCPLRESSTLRFQRAERGET